MLAIDKFAILECVLSGRKAFSANTGETLYKHEGRTYKVIGYAASELMARAIVERGNATRLN